MIFDLVSKSENLVLWMFIANFLYFFHHSYGKNLLAIINWWTEFIVKTIWMKWFKVAANIKNKFWLSQQMQRKSFNNIVINTTIWRVDRICIATATDGLYIYLACLQRRGSLQLWKEQLQDFIIISFSYIILKFLMTLIIWLKLVS